MIATIAARQHGVVARRQLLAAGLKSGAIVRRIAADRLHPLHNGVYAVGYALVSREGRWMAAVLAGGPGAVLSHRAAAALWLLRDSGGIEITVQRNRRTRQTVMVHRSPLAPDEITTHRGIPTTTVARTLLDLAAIVPRHHIEKAIHEAEVQRLGDDTNLTILVARRPRHAGATAIRAILEERLQNHGVTRSELEDRFLSLVAHAGLPQPRTNRNVEAKGRLLECDCVWPDARLIVELDGAAAHHTRRAFERDRERDRRLQATGWRVVRVTWTQLTRTPRQVAADLRALLTSPLP